MRRVPAGTGMVRLGHEAQGTEALLAANVNKCDMDHISSQNKMVLGIFWISGIWRITHDLADLPVRLWYGCSGCGAQDRPGLQMPAYQL